MVINENHYLRYWGDPVLRQECEEIEDFDSPELYELLDDMGEIKYNKGGVGLAAPQIGEAKQVILADVGGYEKEFINPEITEKKWYIPSIEGCLSIPFLPVVRLRNYSVTVDYQDRYGESHTDTYRGFDAIVMQHEIDHIHGKLMIDLF